MSEITGIHHITAIAGDPQENLDFYTGVMGMRLVKKSVNQDVVNTYHLFYADGEAHPGTDLTFFPWPDAPPAVRGIGLGAEISLAVPAGSLGFWESRLSRHGTTVGSAELRRGNRVLPVTDPHGQPLALVETTDPREFTPWSRSPVPQEHQILGLDAVRLLERDTAPSAEFLTGVLGFTDFGPENGWHRYGVGTGGSGQHLEIRAQPDTRRGQWGVGSMHHVAWRVPDDANQLAVRTKVGRAGRRPTDVIDRFWFRSVYFMEPGGVLFEVATDGPGFTVDEELSTLGERLVLPPWLETHRAAIERELPPLVAQVPVAD
jgi:glyoxalase family protein